MRITTASESSGKSGYPPGAMLRAEQRVILDRITADERALAAELARPLWFVGTQADGSGYESVPDARGRTVVVWCDEVPLRLHQPRFSIGPDAGQVRPLAPLAVVRGLVGRPDLEWVKFLLFRRSLWVQVTRLVPARTRALPAELLVPTLDVMPFQRDLVAADAPVDDPEPPRPPAPDWVCGCGATNSGAVSICEACHER